jgi:hypothetical protein
VGIKNSAKQFVHQVSPQNVQSAITAVDQHSEPRRSL